MNARMVMLGAVVFLAGMLAGCEEPPKGAGGAGGAGGVSPTGAPSKPVQAVNATTRASVAAVRPTKPPVLGPMGPSIVILPARIDEPEIRVRLTLPQERPPAVTKNRYHGRVDILRMADGKYIAVNVLPLDVYLEGVLTKELYKSWEPATYRAQAIAARTYALYMMFVQGRGRQWDVNSDETSQMYGGIAGETAKSRDAVAETRGQVLTATVDGKTGIFCSLYSACSGGATQDPYEAWGDSKVGPLAARVIGNVDDNCDKFIWKTNFVATKEDVTRCIQSWGARNNYPSLQALAKIQSAQITRRNATTTRPTEFTLTDVNGRSAIIRAEEFRLALVTDPLDRAPKPYSSFFEIRSEGDTFVMWNGRGYGHGIGMSQWGAEALAKEGQTHGQILAFFYPGAGMETLW